MIPLYLLTLNCGKLKVRAELASRIRDTLPDTPADLYVFALQEVCSILDGTVHEYVQRHLIDINRVLLDALKAKYTSGTGFDYNFTSIALNHVGAMGLIAVTPFPLRFRDTRFASASCGSAGSLLKGGVGLRVKHVSAEGAVELTFAAAHLAANEGEVNFLRRTQDIQTIMRGLDFGDGYSFLKPGCHAFFMGDLNFRTTKDLKKSTVATGELVELQDQTNDTATDDKIVKLVHKYDELTKARVEGEVFLGFNEATITFRPTYKYHVNTAIYNTKRSPLWCDRILYQATFKSGEPVPVIHTYNSIPEYMASDHRPVYLHISVPHAPPESIISHSGHLIVLPTVRSADQARDYAADLDSMCGPTQKYMKCTALDKVNQLLVRRVADFAIGRGLWLGTTSSGRLTVLGAVLLVWLVLTIKL